MAQGVPSDGIQSNSLSGKDSFMKNQQHPLLSSRRPRSVVSALLALLAAVPALVQAFPVTVIDPGNPPLPLTVESTNDILEVKQQINTARG